MQSKHYARWHVALSVILAAALLLGGAVPAGAVTVIPNSIGAVGDSLTTAYNTGSSAFRDAPANSWSTGTTASVNSLYLRFRALNPALNGQNYNYAVSGAKMDSLNTQVTNLLNARPGIQYVTILMGGNDVCTSSESTMTSVANFRAQFQTTLATLNTRLQPGAQVYVLSIPNVYQLWSVLKNNGSARFTWSLFRICQSMLYRAGSTSSTDEARRQRVRQRNIDFNTVLQTECAGYAFCRFDGNAVFNTAFIASDISTRDYFHPSLAGQAKLATVAWAAAP